MKITNKCNRQGRVAGNNEWLDSINGADAERLADCIKFAANHALEITEHTQSGLNEGSGNVWLWDEDWPACVYTSISFDTRMSWSCPECGEEVDCDTPKQADELNEHYNEVDGCVECKS